MRLIPFFLLFLSSFRNCVVFRVSVIWDESLDEGSGSWLIFVLLRTAVPEFAGFLVACASEVLLLAVVVVFSFCSLVEAFEYL